MRSGEQTVKRIFSKARKTHFTSRSGGLEASRTTLVQTVRKKIEAIIAEEFFWRATPETADGEESVQRSSADFLENGL